MCNFDTIVTILPFNHIYINVLKMVYAENFPNWLRSTYILPRGWSGPWIDFSMGPRVDTPGENCGEGGVDAGPILL